MSADLPLEQQAVLAETLVRERSGLSPRELTSELLIAIAFVLAVGALWLVDPPGPTHWAQALICLAATTAAMRVCFQTPLGFTVATQLAFIPLAFAVAPALLPLAVLIAVLLSRVPELVAGEMAPLKLLQGPSNSFFSLGPASVFALAGGPRGAGPAILLAALSAQFAADFAGSALYNAVARGASVRSQLSEVWWVWGVDAALSANGLVLAVAMTRHPVAVLAVLPLLILLGVFARERAGRFENLVELNATYRGTALLLGDVVEADDSYTGTHSQGVVALALAVGEELGLDPVRRRNLEFAALLHDVGKIAIPKEILNKPGRLDAREWALMKTHAAEGERMLTRVGGFMVQVGAIVRSHHERWDGAGYPDGLLADAAPLESRIITCCDSWHAMRTDRPYRRALDVAAAVAEVQDNLGGQFDPVAGRALLRVVLRPHVAAPAADARAPVPATALLV